MIPQDVLDGYMSSLFGNSEPGKILHALLVAAADPGAVNALGIPDLAVYWYAIAPTAEVNPEQFIAQTIMASIVQARAKGTEVHFAGLATEAHTVVDDGTEVTENRARVLLADHRLEEHPAAVEVTRLYAACRAGRRWYGVHTLTGPKAGTVAGPYLRWGGLRPEERGLHQNLIRTAVGIDTPARTRP